MFVFSGLEVKSRGFVYCKMPIGGSKFLNFRWADRLSSCTNPLIWRPAKGVVLAWKVHNGQMHAVQGSSYVIYEMQPPFVRVASKSIPESAYHLLK